MLVAHDIQEVLLVHVLGQVCLLSLLHLLEVLGVGGGWVLWLFGLLVLLLLGEGVLELLL